MMKKNNVVVDEIYLKQAYRIRHDFEHIQLLAFKKDKDIKQIREKIETLKNDLINAKNMVKKGDKTFLEKVYSLLDELNEETLKIGKILKPLEERREKLQKDENVLKDTLIEKYPHYTENELKLSIGQYIIERKNEEV